VTLRFTASPADAGARPDRALRNRHPDLTRDRALALLKQGRIWVDGSPARLSTTLRAGSAVQVEASAASLGPQAIEPFHVLHHDGDLLVVDKAAGVAMHRAGVEEDSVTLEELVREAYPRAPVEGDTFESPSFLGRLDRPTSGLVVCALSRAALSTVEPAWRSGALHKEYLVVVHGRPADEGLIELPLSARRPRSRGKGIREDARTAFVTLGTGGGLSLVRATLLTGRTHQIRRHMKAIGHPVVGDDRYGHTARDEALAKAGVDLGLMLHAWRIHHDGQAPLPTMMTAPPPERFAALLTPLHMTLPA
jgi:RluA family pseudouridine synthase